jgi:hypothetical protein
LELARYVCDRCGTTFDAPAARCPKCLRKSTVRETSERSSTDAVRLAAGDQSQSPAARRATALFAAVVLSALPAFAIAQSWRTLVAFELTWPAIAAACIAAGAFVWTALGLTVSDRWASFASRCAVGAAIAVWAFFSGALALSMTDGISVGITLIAAVVLFGGGVVGVLRWLEARDKTPAPPTGKWR